MSKQTKKFSQPTEKQPKKTKKQPCESLLRQLADEYEKKLSQAREGQLKAVADYNNLVKRQAQTQQRLTYQASLELIEKLLSPLHHLSLAADHLGDQGVQMVADEFWQVLNTAGLEEINPLGEQFDETLMEAVDKSGDGDKVTKVVQRGYRFKDQVIKPAKVVVG